MPDPYEIATWRFEQIAPLVDPSLGQEERALALRHRGAQAVEWPGGEERGQRGERPVRKPIPKSTLYRWLEAYRREGYLGLVPKPRGDRGASRRPRTASWIHYAIGLLYERPGRSLTQLEIYLGAEFPDYRLGRSSLARHLRAHPAYGGIEKLRAAAPARLRDLYEAQRPHEGWQLDGKGPFAVRLKDGGRVSVHVISILDDYSRAILASVVAKSESTEAAIAVFEKAVAKWGLADRFQFDRGSAFDSHAFRTGLAQLGVHRNAVAAGHPEAQGKIEAYHRCLNRWFVEELAAQEVVDLDHLQQLLEAMVALLYNRHLHREIGTSPEKRLAGRLSPRRVSPQDLERAFFLETSAKSHPKTGEVHLPNGSFRVPAPYAGRRGRFRHHPLHGARAVLLGAEGSEIELEPFTRKPLAALRPELERRGTGQLQKLLDLWRGEPRPNAQPGFGLPEIFGEVGKLLGRLAPSHEREARAVLAFYRKWGPLAREGFLAACQRTRAALGQGRPLSAYLEDLERQIAQDRNAPSPQPLDPTEEENDP